MKRWALVINGVCVSVTEQETEPEVFGPWVDVTSLFVGPGYTWNGSEWAPPSELQE